MIVITGANYKFEFFAITFVKMCNRIGYVPSVYDLGGLSFGNPMTVDDTTFQKSGYYHVMDGQSGWCTRALHKPDIIGHALNSASDDIITYMDADAFPVSNFDEVLQYDFDIGVTVRNEFENVGKLGRINAGVLFFRKSAEPFISEWKKLTMDLKNDQVALNKMVNSGKFKVKEFPTRVYNYYYFPEAPVPEVKIYHFKSASDVRNEYCNYASRYPKTWS